MHVWILYNICVMIITVSFQGEVEALALFLSSSLVGVQYSTFYIWEPDVLTTMLDKPHNVQSSRVTPFLGTCICCLQSCTH